MSPQKRFPEPQLTPARAIWRQKVHEVIFGAETRSGKAFDVALLWIIGASVLVVMLESVKPLEDTYGMTFKVLEWMFTIIFTVEYILRILSLRKPLSYVFSFFGIIDLLAIIPTYLSLFLTGAQAFVVIRILRLLRMFRLFKMMRHVSEANVLLLALKDSRAKITVFLMGVLGLVVIFGTLIYIIEGGEPDTQFTSIPESIYWAIITVTTVGYGDIAPVTVLGKALTSIAVIVGYGIIAVPFGIVSIEIQRAVAKRKEPSNKACADCGSTGHTTDAAFCKYCGGSMDGVKEAPKSPD